MRVSGVVPILVCLALAGCRAVSPLTPPESTPESDVHPRTEWTEVRLGRALHDLVWRWESPDGTSPERPDTFDESVAEFGRRFAVFCRDTGIVGPGEAPLVVQRNHVLLEAGGRAWKRFAELHAALGDTKPDRSVALDLLVLEVPGGLARRWGLDGLPAAEQPPAPFAKDIPSVLDPEQFDALRAAILKQRGCRVFATASMVTDVEVEAVVGNVVETAVPEEPEFTLDGDVPVVRMNFIEMRDLGVRFSGQVTAHSRPSERCTVEVDIEVSSLDSWVVYNSEHFRTPLIAKFKLETRASCTMGHTMLLGRAFQTGQAFAALNVKPPRQSCLLAFVTPRWLREPIRCSALEYFSSQSGQLLVFPLNHNVIRSLTRKTKTGWDEKIGDDDDGDDGDDDSDDDSDDGHTRRLREFLASYGISCDAEVKAFYVRQNVVVIAPSDTIQKVQRIFSELGWDDFLMLSRQAAIQISPRLWREVTAGRPLLYGQSGQVLTQEETRQFLGRVAQDRGSRILSATAALQNIGTTARLRDVVELSEPVGWDRHLVGKRSLWLPKWCEARDVGSILGAPGSWWTYDVRKNFTVELEPGYTEFLRWLPCGPGLGFPQYRVHTLPTKTTIERGTYILIGGASGAGQDGPLVVWLVGMDWCW